MLFGAFSELKEAVQDYLNDNLDEWEAFYGDNVKVKLKFKNKEKASRDDIKTANFTNFFTIHVFHIISPFHVHVFPDNLEMLLISF